MVQKHLTISEPFGPLWTTLESWQACHAWPFLFVLLVHFFWTPCSIWRFPLQRLLKSNIAQQKSQMLCKDYSLTTQVKMVVGIGGLHWGNKGELANIIMLPPLQSIPLAPSMIFIELLKPPSRNDCHKRTCNRQPMFLGSRGWKGGLEVKMRCCQEPRFRYTVQTNATCVSASREICMPL